MRLRGQKSIGRRVRRRRRMKWRRRMKRRRDSTITIPVVGGDEMEVEGLKNKRGKEREREI